MDVSLSRRGFVTTAAATAGALTLGGVCAEEAQDAAAEVGPIEPLTAPQTWDEEFDVVVIGAGGGLAAGVRVAELGARVLIVDKMPDVGGASKEASVWVVSGSQPQLDLGMPDVTDKLLESARAANPFGERHEAYTGRPSRDLPGSPPPSPETRVPWASHRRAPRRVA